MKAPNPQKKNYNRDRKSIPSVARYSGMAFQMMAIIGLGIWGGIWLDEKFPMGFPLFTLILALISVGSAIYLTVRDLL